MFDIITFGTATKDIFLRTKENAVIEDDVFSTKKGVCFPLGSKVKMEEIYFTSGGGGTNTAATFAKQGFNVAYCGKVGNDSAGENILKELRQYGISTNLISFTDEEITNHSIVFDVPDIDRTIFIYRGASDLHSEKDVKIDKLQAKWFYLASFSSQSIPLFYRLVEHAVSSGIKMMMNPSKAQLEDERVKDALGEADVVLLNMEEAAVVTGLPYTAGVEIVNQMAKIISGVVLITQGVKGVYAHHNDMFYRVRPVFPDAIDRTGAGDSFGSGFLSEFMRSNDMEASLQLAIANSTSCLQKKGAKHGLLEKGAKYEINQLIAGSDPAKLIWED